MKPLHNVSAIVPHGQGLLALDRALRDAREQALGAGSLSDALWSLLVELLDHPHGVAFETLNVDKAIHLSRPTLVRCLAMLEERGLVKAGGNGPATLLAHLTLTERGHSLINSVLANAVSLLAEPQGRSEDRDVA